MTSAKPNHRISHLFQSVNNDFCKAKSQNESFVSERSMTSAKPNHRISHLFQSVNNDFCKAKSQNESFVSER